MILLLSNVCLRLIDCLLTFINIIPCFFVNRIFNTHIVSEVEKNEDVQVLKQLPVMYN